MKNWVCADSDCRHLVVADRKPQPIRWTDGHVCYFIDESTLIEEATDPGEMDGDATSALASAGWGTDEDYGYYGGDE